MTKEQAIEKVNAFLKELRDNGYSLEPVLRSNAMSITADLNLRPLTVDELPKKEENVAPEAV